MTSSYHASQHDANQLQLFVFSKVCTKCGIEKPLKAFSLQKRGIAGRRADCTKCKGKANQERILHPDREPISRKKAPLEIPSHKICAICEKDKSLTDFSPSKLGTYGRYKECKSCINAIGRAKRTAKNAGKPIPRPGYRFCRKCNEELPEEAFNMRNAEGKRHAQCKNCIAEYAHARQQKPEVKERQRLNRATDKQRQRHAANYIKKKETYQANGRKWRQANPEKNRAANLRRKAHKLNAIIEDVDYKAILERDGAWCYICEKPIDLTVKSRTTASLNFDHKIPLQPRTGEPQGSHTQENIHPAHHACNVRKGNVPFELLTNWQRRGIQ